MKIAGRVQDYVLQVRNWRKEPLREENFLRSFREVLNSLLRQMILALKLSSATYLLVGF
jgi:hypothetical protein